VLSEAACQKKREIKRSTKQVQRRLVSGCVGGLSLFFGKLQSFFSQPQAKKKENPATTAMKQRTTETKPTARKQRC
jgi:hypothetical protein